MYGPPSNGTKIPHSLRIVIFFLRLALGLNFFYIGFNKVFGLALVPGANTGPIANLYSWFGTYTMNHTVTSWTFMAIGACLILGFLARLASLAGIVIIIGAYLPNIDFYKIFNLSQFINAELILFFCFLILLVSRTGEYLGFDSFIHFSLGHKK